MPRPLLREICQKLRASARRSSSRDNAAWAERAFRHADGGGGHRASDSGTETRMIVFLGSAMQNPQGPLLVRSCLGAAPEEQWAETARPPTRYSGRRRSALSPSQRSGPTICGSPINRGLA
jgi:hypothetical protein